MPLLLIPVIALAGMFVGSQIDDAIDQPSLTPDNVINNPTGFFTISNGVKLAVFGGAALVALKVAKQAKLL